jgi:hypothetical protein
MKNHNQKLVKTLLATLFFLAIMAPVSAQIGVPDPPDDTAVAAIDGFVGVALAIGAIAGVKKQQASKACKE